MASTGATATSRAVSSVVSKASPSLFCPSRAAKTRAAHIHTATCPCVYAATSSISSSASASSVSSRSSASPSAASASQCRRAFASAAKSSLGAAPTPSSSSSLLSSSSLSVLSSSSAGLSALNNASLYSSKAQKSTVTGTTAPTSSSASASGTSPSATSSLQSFIPTIHHTSSSSPSGAANASAFSSVVLGSSDDVPIEAWKQPPTMVTKLANGLRVASQWTPDGTVTAGVWIDSGSRFERKETNGAAHFLEHMIFKGTKKRSRIQLEKEIEDMGAHLNAYTAREQTVYYAKVFKKDLDQCMDLMSDILTNSTLEEDAMEVEKRVIMREMQEVEKSTDEVIFDRLHMTAFRDSPLGFTILGPSENIQNMKREHLIEYIERNYTADRMVIAAAGDVDHGELVKLVEKHFSKIPSSRGSSIIHPTESKPHFCGSELIYRNDDMGPIAHLAVGFEGVPWTSPDAVTFMLMQSIVGSYRKHDEGLVAGKLSGNSTIRNVANKMTVGCAEMFSAFNTCYRDTGLFGFYAQCDEVAVEHCVGELMFGITSLSYNVTEEEVQRAKQVLKTQLFGSLDTTTAVAEDIGRSLLVYGRRIPLVEFIKRLDAIDAEEIKRVAWNRLHDREVAVTAVGPLTGMPQLIDIRRMTFWLRY